MTSTLTVGSDRDTFLWNASHVGSEYKHIIATDFMRQMQHD